MSIVKHNFNRMGQSLYKKFCLCNSQIFDQGSMIAKWLRLELVFHLLADFLKAVLTCTRVFKLAKDLILYANI